MNLPDNSDDRHTEQNAKDRCADRPPSCSKRVSGDLNSGDETPNTDARWEQGLQFYLSLDDRVEFFFDQ